MAFGRILLVMVLVAGPTFFLTALGRRFLPRLICAKTKSGFGGALVLFVLGQVAVTEYLFWQGYVVATSFPWSEYAEGLDRFAAYVTVGPSFIQALLGLALLVLLVTKRSSAALAGVIVLLWLMGPVAVLIESWYFQLAFSVSALLPMFLWAAFWTAYLVLSPRVAFTYGTVRGHRLAD